MADVSLDEFQAEVTAFLDANATPRAKEAAFEWGKGRDDQAMFEEVDRTVEQEQLAVAKEFRAKRFDAGLAWITGPKDFGGRELSSAHDRLYTQLESRYETPGGGFFGIGLGMVAPTIHAHAEPHIQKEYLPKLYRGDLVGCQLFSEPGAGSDLASLQTKAERDGDEWVITGQKVWTSGAHYSDIGEIIARTDPNQPKHKGLTGFVVDMKAKGVEVRPLRQMTGGAAFNEVFFDEVRVPDDHRLGDVGQGWTVALTTLMNERASIGTGGAGGNGGGGITRFIEMARHYGVVDDPLVRQELARLYIGQKISGYTNQRAMDRMKSGQTPGPEMSLSKMALVNNMLQQQKLLGMVLGSKLVVDTGEWGTFSNHQYVLGLPAMRIAGGSDEVMRNIVGERVLGLPKDVGIDTTSPFKDIKVGTQR
jgi:alkylation response protein AidB-like acyl-CoA dehydrogenase